MEAVPYFRLGWSLDRIATLMRRSKSTVNRWRSHPDVKKALGEIETQVLEETKAVAAELATSALEALKHLVQHADDERVRLDAVKTTLDRFGYPETKISEHTGDGGGPIVQVNMTQVQARAVAQGALEGTSDE